MDDDLYIEKLQEFRDDHKRHIKELSEVLRAHKEDAPETPSLTKGKVILADLIDKEAILSAMKSNECDTNTAYERMMERTDKWWF